MRRLDEVVDEAAVTLAGMRPDDQGAALATACESVAESLHEQSPELSDEEVRTFCVEVARRVKRRLAQFDAQDGNRGALH